MDFASTRIITDNVKRLVQFYEAIGLTAVWYTDDFAELPAGSATLAIGSTRTMDLFGAGAAVAQANRSVIVEFRVRNVDEAYRKLEGVIDSVVQEPTTQPWGNRSLLIRDPDGNLVNLFTPVTAEAIERYSRS
jgi:catechol 2,3-dioxygenase-like lactoylglutathione lyase family enzyme